MSKLLKFPSVWFLPYVLAYVGFWAFRIPSNSLVSIFLALHVVLGLEICRRLWRSASEGGDEWIVLAVVLCLLVGLPGAYLEYPSDSWEHVRRIFRWQELGLIGDYPANSKYKFAYFWAFTFLKWLPIEWRRVGLDVCSAFWQLVLSFQIYRLSRTLGASKSEAALQIFGYLLLFGGNMFTIRYYALSSTPLAFVAYFDFVILLLGSIESRRWMPILLTPVPLLVMLLNHFQELLFALISATALGICFVYRNCSPSARRKFLHGGVVLGLVSVATGYYCIHYLPELYSRMDPVQISRFGTFRLWSLAHRYYLETFGIHGLVSVVVALLIVRRNPYLSALSLAPLFTLLFPVTVLLYSRYMPSGYVTYRILYGFPLSIVLVHGIWMFTEKSFWSPQSLALRFGVAFLAVLVISAPYSFPWRGRLAFALESPPTARTLLPLDQTATWFSENRDLAHLRYCWLVSDNATLVVLAAHLGLNEWYYGGEAARRARENPSLESIVQTAQSAQEIVAFAERKQPFCGVLVADAKAIPPTPHSFISAASHHWRDPQGDLAWYQNETFAQAASGLPALGWKKTSVPPFYSLYEPPTPGAS